MLHGLVISAAPWGREPPIGGRRRDARRRRANQPGVPLHTGPHNRGYNGYRRAKPRQKSITRCFLPLPLSFLPPSLPFRSFSFHLPRRCTLQLPSLSPLQVFPGTFAPSRSRGRRRPPRWSNDRTGKERMTRTGEVLFPRSRALVNRSCPPRSSSSSSRGKDKRDLVRPSGLTDDLP